MIDAFFHIFKPLSFINSNSLSLLSSFKPTKKIQAYFPFSSFFFNYKEQRICE